MKLILFSILILLANVAFSQNGPAVISTSFFPKNAVWSTIYIAKFDHITPIELHSINTDKSLHNELISSKAEEYNLIAYRKLNNYIQSVAGHELDSTLQFRHERDLNEDTNVRFIIYPETSKFDLVLNENLSKFYLYDRKENITYKPTSLNTLLMIRRKALFRYRRMNSDKVDQDEVDTYISSIMPKPKKPIPSGVKWAFGIILYGLFTWGIIVLQNL